MQVDEGLEQFQVPTLEITNLADTVLLLHEPVWTALWISSWYFAV